MKPVGSVMVWPSPRPDRAHCLVAWSRPMITAASTRTTSSRLTGLTGPAGPVGPAGPPAGGVGLVLVTPAPGAGWGRGRGGLHRRGRPGPAHRRGWPWRAGRVAGYAAVPQAGHGRPG